jgi:hypothetical protein
MKYIIDFLVFDILIISAKDVFHIKIFYFSNNFTSTMSLYWDGYDRQSWGFSPQQSFDPNSFWYQEYKEIYYFCLK